MSRLINIVLPFIPSSEPNPQHKPSAPLTELSQLTYSVDSPDGKPKLTFTLPGKSNYDYVTITRKPNPTENSNYNDFLMVSGIKSFPENKKLNHIRPKVYSPNQASSTLKSEYVKRPHEHIKNVALFEGNDALQKVTKHLNNRYNIKTSISDLKALIDTIL